jgi:hypothetical protein
MASLSDKQRQLHEAEAEAKVDAAAAQEAATAAGTAPAPHDALMGSFEQGTGPPPHRPRAHPDKESNPEAGRVQGGGCPGPAASIVSRTEDELG